MPAGEPSFDDLLREATSAPVAGWDLGRLGERVQVDVPWDYDAVVSAHTVGARSLLDLGTGGGEWLAAHRPLAPLTVATECWPPNALVAARTLRPLGAHVVRVEAADDNDQQGDNEQQGDNDQQARGPVRGRLPFRDACFDAVVDRNEAFVADEVARVLAPGGTFVTEQVGPGCHDDLYTLLELTAPPPARWALDMAVRQVRAAGLEVVDAADGLAVRTFADMGAVAWWLRQVPWAVEGFTVEGFRDRLAAAYARGGPYAVREPRFRLVARRVSG
jgi:SAM-dependent methyltransferase